MEGLSAERLSEFLECPNLWLASEIFSFWLPIFGPFARSLDGGQGRFKIRWDPVSGQELVFDDADVPIREISGNELIRAKRVGVQQGSPGVPDNGEVLPDNRNAFDQETESQKSSVSVGEFVSATWR